MRLLIASVLLLASQAALGQSLVLRPACEPYECGASVQGARATRPNTAVQWESQRVRIEIAAESLLRDSFEHVVVSLMSGALPFAADGSYAQPHGPGGGLGVAIGSFDHRVHPACPPDPQGDRFEIAIERFGWGDPYASRLPFCTSLPLATLDRTPVLELRLGVECHGTESCSVNAVVADPDTDAVLTTLDGHGLSLANPGLDRSIWYGVTNIQFDDPVRAARLRVLDEHYHAEP